MYSLQKNEINLNEIADTIIQNNEQRCERQMFRKYDFTKKIFTYGAPVLFGIKLPFRKLIVGKKQNQDKFDITYISKELEQNKW